MYQAKSRTDDTVSLRHLSGGQGASSGVWVSLEV